MPPFFRATPCLFFVCGLFLSATAAHGQLSGSDDFNDNSKDATKWGTDVVTGGASLVEVNGRLEYRVGTTSPEDDVRRPWVLNTSPNGTAFDLYLDVFNNVSPGGSDNASIGLTVTSLEQANDNLYIELFRSGPSGDGKGFLGALRTTALNVEGDHEVLDAGGNYTQPTSHPAVTTGSVRISYNPATKIFTTYYDPTGSADGLQWQAYGSFGVSAAGGGSMRNGVWQLTQNRGFQVSVSAFSEGITVASGAVHADNFSVPSVRVLGLVKTRHHTQLSATTTALGEFSMQGFMEGQGLSSTFPASSVRFQPPGGSDTPLVFEADAGGWFYESTHASQSALDTAFPNGTHSFKVGSFPAVSLSLTGNSYPVVPVVTATAGTWSNGRLLLTPAQAAAGFSLSTNVSTSQGVLSLEVYSDSPWDDVLYETIDENPLGNQSLNVAVPAGRLSTGVIYTAEAEFDQSVASPISQAWALPGASGYALYSSRTNFEIQVVTAQEGWRQQYFGSTANTGAGADMNDHDKDGLLNLLEWAAGLSPTASSPMSTTTVRNGANIEHTYSRSTAAVAAGATFTVEWSDTLASGSWSTADVTQAIQTDNGTLQQVKATLPAGTQGRRFVRLKVTAP